jgi:hypothetical protein
VGELVVVVFPFLRKAPEEARHRHVIDEEDLLLRVPFPVGEVAARRPEVRHGFQMEPVGDEMTLQLGVPVKPSGHAEVRPLRIARFRPFPRDQPR